MLLDRERDRRTSPSSRGDDADRDALRCAACDHVITDPAYRIEMSGAHEHSFVNPGGFVHHIGCFAAAPGCIHLGDPEAAFSWFPGWTWQLAACARCRAHLGWIYRNAGEQFHGLIVRMLRGA
ncbi:MAG TPA: cereblon family protein [Kofleriaceae bacterium]|nr:cereblon family protein [Kofleriaceae bacterium]